MRLVCSYNCGRHSWFEYFNHITINLTFDWGRLLVVHIQISLRKLTWQHAHLKCTLLDPWEQQQQNTKSSRRCRNSKLQPKTHLLAECFFDWWRWDSIGPACEPKCGGCRCGKCQPGGKKMTLSKERALEVIRKGLTYVKADAHSSKPHWDTVLVDRKPGLNNRSGGEAIFLRTEKRLKREPEWKTAYRAQVHEMVESRAAKKLSVETICCSKGLVRHVSYLVAPNPHFVTTPVCLVWNSSQRFKGHNMNDLPLKGPDVLNPIKDMIWCLKTIHCMWPLVFYLTKD